MGGLKSQGTLYNNFLIFSFVAVFISNSPAFSSRRDTVTSTDKEVWNCEVATQSWLYQHNLLIHRNYSVISIKSPDISPRLDRLPQRSLSLHQWGSFQTRAACSWPGWSVERWRCALHGRWSSWRRRCLGRFRQRPRFVAGVSIKERWTVVMHYYHELHGADGWPEEDTRYLEAEDLTD